jgi:pyruvate dehydrogenase E1 component
MNENYAHPGCPRAREQGILKGMYKFSGRRRGRRGPRVQLLGSGVILREVIAGGRAAEEGLGCHLRRVELPQLQRAAPRRHRRVALEPAASRRERRASRTSSSAWRPTKGPVIASTDYIRSFADQIREFVPRRYKVLGADGYGRSDSRENLRRFFEVNRFYVVVAALKALAEDGEVPAAKVAEAIKKYGIDANKPEPWTA